MLNFPRVLRRRKKREPFVQLIFEIRTPLYECWRRVGPLIRRDSLALRVCLLYFRALRSSRYAIKQRRKGVFSIIRGLLSRDELFSK